MNGTQTNLREVDGHRGGNSVLAARITRLSDNPLALAALSASLGFVVGGLLMSFRRPKVFLINVEKIEARIRQVRPYPD